MFYTQLTLSKTWNAKNRLTDGFLAGFQLNVWVWQLNFVGRQALVGYFELSHGSSFSCKNNLIFLCEVWIIYFFQLSSVILCLTIWSTVCVFPLRSFWRMRNKGFFFPEMLTFFFPSYFLVIENIVWDKSGFSVRWLVFKPQQSSRQSSTLRFFQLETWSLSLLLHGTLHTFYTGPCWCESKEHGSGWAGTWCFRVTFFLIA